MTIIVYYSIPQKTTKTKLTCIYDPNHVLVQGATTEKYPRKFVTEVEDNCDITSDILQQIILREMHTKVLMKLRINSFNYL